MAFFVLFFAIDACPVEGELLLRASVLVRRCGGIGRRDGFKIRFLNGSGGSIPSTGTIKSLYLRASAGVVLPLDTFLMFPKNVM